MEAANYLSVSRPFIIKEVEARRLKHRMVGTHRRIEFDELQAYGQRMRQQQQGALQRMTDNARELGLDDASRQPVIETRALRSTTDKLGEAVMALSEGVVEAAVRDFDALRKEAAARFLAKP